MQREHSDGQRRHAGLLGRTRGTPGSTQIPRARGRWFAIRPSQRRHGTSTRRRSNGMSQLFKMDGECKILPLILYDGTPMKAHAPTIQLFGIPYVMCYYYYVDSIASDEINKYNK